MRILIAYKVAEDVLHSILDDNIIYRPDLQAKGSRFVSKALRVLKPDVLIAQELPQEQAVKSWVSAMPEKAPFIVLHVNSQQAQEARQFWFAGVPVFPSVPNDETHPDIQPLILAERVNTSRLVHVVEGNTRAVSSGQTSVVLIGAGIVNLITAHYLALSGYSVAIYDASPDPRASEHWSKYGCSRSGGDARMFSIRENNNYNDSDFTGVDRFNNKLFRTSVSKRGWALCDTNNLSEPEQTWIQE